MSEKPFEQIDFDEEALPACEYVEYRCGPCGSMEYSLRFFRKTRQIGLYCSQGHTSKALSGGVWLGNDLFKPGGKYDGLTPVGWFPAVVAKKTRSTSTRLKEQAITKALQAVRCVICKVIPFTDANPIQTFRSIEEYRPNFFAEIAPHLKEIPRTAVADWISFLPAALAADVAKTKAESRLQADHIIPASVLSDLNSFLSTQEREIARSHALPLCQNCNRGRGAGIYTDDQLTSYYARAYYNGDIKAMTAFMGPTWVALLALNLRARRFVGAGRRELS